MKLRGRALGAAAAVAAGLLLVFWAYLDPHLALELANALWACF
jgi:hypothetical protein